MRVQEASSLPHESSWEVCVSQVLTCDLSKHSQLPSMLSLHLKPTAQCTLNRRRGGPVALSHSLRDLRPPLPLLLLFNKN